MENTLKITVFHLFNKLLLNIAYSDDGYGLAIQKLRENTSFFVLNTYTEAFLKFPTT